MNHITLEPQLSGDAPVALTLHNFPAGRETPGSKPTPAQTVGPVRRYLRHRETQQYFREGGWTPDMCEAQAFRDALQAASVCAAQGLTDVDLVLRFSNGTADLFCTPIR